MNNQGFREIFSLNALGLKQLNDTLRTLWAKVMGGIDMKDLSREVKVTIDGKADSGEVETLSTLVQQTAEEVSLKANSSVVNELGDRVSDAETGLALKADSATLTSTANGLQSQISAVPGQITAAVESIDELYAGTSVKITPTDGLRVDQYLPGNTEVPFYTQISSGKFGVYRTADDIPAMEAGADADGKGFVATNRLKDVSVASDLYLRVFADENNWATGIALCRQENDGSETVLSSWTTSEFLTTITTLNQKASLYLSENYGNPNGGARAELEGSLYNWGETENDNVGRAEIVAGFRDYDYINGVLITAYNYDQFAADSHARIEIRPEGTHDNPEIELRAGEGASLTWLRFTMLSNGTGLLRIRGRLHPDATNTDDIGSTSNRWRYIYLNNSPNVSSDARVKRDISDLTSALALVLALRPRAYRMVDDAGDAPIRMGLVAQEVRDALRSIGLDGAHLLDDSDPDHLALAYDELIAPLVGAVQAQQRRIDALEARLSTLEKLLLSNER